MDIAKITPKERTIEIKNPGTGDPLGISVTLMSADDPRLKAQQRRLQDTQSERQRRGKFLTAEEMEEGITKLLAQTITGWDWGSNEYNGEIPDFTPAKAVEIMSAVPWFRAQINDELSDSKSFFQN